MNKNKQNNLIKFKSGSPSTIMNEIDNNKMLSKMQTIHKQASHSILKGRDENYFMHLYQSSNFPFQKETALNTLGVNLNPLPYPASLINQNSNAEVKSIIEKLLQTKQVTLDPKKFHHHKDHHYSKNKEVLADMEQKIFHEVVSLALEIDQLKDKIETEVQQVKQLTISNPDISDKIQYHGYTQRLTLEDVNDLEQENAILAQQLTEFTETQHTYSNNLEDILLIQKDKYQQLKRQLTTNSKVSHFEESAENIENLKKEIFLLENTRKNRLFRHHPEIQRLKNENEHLRQKTLVNLKQQFTRQSLYEREQELSRYLEEEEQNKLIFFEELTKFKAQYNKIKEENQLLSEKLESKRQNTYKENSMVLANNSNSYTRNKRDQSNQEASSMHFRSENNRQSYNSPTHKSNSPGQPSQRKGKSRLGEYQSFINQMQNVNRN